MIRINPAHPPAPHITELPMNFLEFFLDPPSFISMPGNFQNCVTSISTDGNQFVSYQIIGRRFSGCISLVNIETEEVKTISLEGSCRACLSPCAFSQKQQMFAILDAHGAIDLFESKREKEFSRNWDDDIYHLTKHSSIDALAFLGNEKKLAFAQQRTIRVWQIGTKNVLSLPHQHGSSIKNLTSLENGKVVASSDLNMILIQRLGTAETLSIQASERILSITAMAEERFLASLHADMSICIWDIKNGSQRFKFKVSKGHTLIPLKSGKKLALINHGQNAEIYVYNLERFFLWKLL